LAGLLTGRGSGLMGRRGSSHGERKRWPYCCSLFRPAAPESSRRAGAWSG
jgi:hypothetical protein